MVAVRLAALLLCAATAPAAQHFQAFFEPLGSGDYVLSSAQVTARLNAERAELGFPAAGTWNSLTLRLMHANKSAHAEGANLLEGTSSYFPGPDSSQWRSGVAHFGSVVAAEIYPGIDIKYYISEQREFEYDFVVRAGSDPGAIGISVEGARSVSVTRNGILEIKLPDRDVSQRLTVYQEIDGKRREVAARFKVRDRQVGFDVGKYDRRYTLIIDPVVLGKTSYIGFGSVAGLAVDSAGNYYVTGNTHQSSLGFAPGLRTFENPGENNVFVAKYNPVGGALLYATFIGTGSTSSSTGIAVNGAGEAYITGASCGNLPVANAFQGVHGGNCDAFLTKLNSAGTGLIYSTYLGGSGAEASRAIALGSDSSAYITGFTQSANFPPLNPAQPANAGGASDGFVAKFGPTGTLQYSTYLGGTLKDDAFAIATDAQGSAYVTGTTASQDFPVAGPQTHGWWTGGDNAFVAKLSPAGNTLAYSTFVDVGTGTGVGVDSALNMYVANISVYKVSPGGAIQRYQTVTGVEEPAVASGGDMYVSGSGTSPPMEGSFPRVFNYVARLDSGGQVVSSRETAASFPFFDGPLPRQRIARDPNGNILIAGSTKVNAAIGDGTVFVSPVACATVPNPLPSFPAAGGPFSMNVSADPGCFWSFVSLSDWLGVVGATGASDGTALLQVAPNTGASRTGSLTLGPVEITVRQDAGSPTMLPNTLNTGVAGGTGEAFSVYVTGPSTSIGIINLLFNDFLDGRHACYVAYVASANILYLVNDTGTGLLPANSTGGTIANSQCTVTLNGFVPNGSFWILQLNIQFNQTNFAKDLIAYGAVRGPGDVTNSGWTVLRTYRVTPLATPSLGPVSFSHLGDTVFFKGLSGPFYSFQAQFRNSSGAQNIQAVEVLIARDLNAINACYFGYDRASNALYLVGDDGDSPVGPLLPGAPPMGPMENSQCAAIGAGTSVVEAGDTLTLTINLAFKPLRAGDDGKRTVYLGVQNQSGGNSDWHAMGWFVLQPF